MKSTATLILLATQALAVPHADDAPPSAAGLPPQALLVIDADAPSRPYDRMIFGGFL